MVERRSVSMGRHDMAQPLSEALEKHYKERVKNLEAQCRDMARELQAYEDKEERLNGVIGELKDENDKLSKALGRVVAGV